MMAGMPSLSMSAGGGGPSGSSSNAGVQTPISNPFNFDHSGWIINNHSDGARMTASGNKDANHTTQTPEGAGGGLSGLLGGMNPLILVGGVIVFLYLRRR